MPGEKLLGKNIFLVMQFPMLAVQFNPGSINWGAKDVKREYTMYGNPLQQQSVCLLKWDQRKGTTKNSPGNRPVDIGENHAAAKHYCGMPMLHHPMFVKVFSSFF